MEKTQEQESGKSYTQPDNAIRYSGQYPHIPELEKPWELTEQVGQGRGKVSAFGKPLQSEGFSKCNALIIQDTEGDSAALFHVEEFDLTRQQIDRLDDLPVGREYVAWFIRGDISRATPYILEHPYFRKRFDTDRRLLIGGEILVKTGDVCWTLVHDPRTQKLQVQSGKEKEVYEFDLKKHLRDTGSTSIMSSEK